MIKDFSKRYTWYPNGSIASPSKFVNLSQTPTPKTISTQQRRPSGIANNPYAKISQQFMQPVAMDGFGFGEAVENFNNQLSPATNFSAVRVN